MLLNFAAGFCGALAGHLLLRLGIHLRRRLSTGLWRGRRVYRCPRCCGCPMCGGRRHINISAHVRK